MREGAVGVAVHRDAEALAAEHEPHDAQFPVLEPVYLRVWTGVEIQQRAGGDEVFATARAGGEEERDVGDLIGQDVDGAVNPDDLLIGVGEDRTAAAAVAALRFAYWRSSARDMSLRV